MYLWSDDLGRPLSLHEVEGLPLADVEPVGEHDVQAEGGEDGEDGHHGDALAAALTTVEVRVLLD